MKTRDHWKWRYDMANCLAQRLDFNRFGIKAVYLIGSVKTGEAGPCSDIDLLVHCEADPEKQEQLRLYLDGWGQGLAIINQQKTTYDTPGSLIDLHIITDRDLAEKTSFAVMLESVSNSAKLLRKAAQ